jgi:hypothetical protein
MIQTPSCSFHLQRVEVSDIEEMMITEGNKQKRQLPLAPLDYSFTILLLLISE